jgi:hypothetical protein
LTTEDPTAIRGIVGKVKASIRALEANSDGRDKSLGKKKTAQ